MKRLIVVALLLAPIVLVSGEALAQIDPEAKLFLGYSYLRVEIDDADEGDAHGGQLEYTYYLNRRAGFTLSAAGHWGTVDAPPNIFVVSQFDLQQVTLMAGPTLVLARSNTVDLELSLLGGAVKRTLEVPGFGSTVADEWDPALGANLTLDLRLSDGIWLRAAQPGVIFARFGDRWETDYRLAVGLVIRSGSIIS